ncbi:hypothetical protein ACEP3O_26095, partial [Pseudomonas aeruginosa]
DGPLGLVDGAGSTDFLQARAGLGRLATDIPDRGRQSFDGSLAVFHVGTQPKGDFEISICHLRITFGGSTRMVARASSEVFWKTLKSGPEAAFYFRSFCR